MEHSAGLGNQEAKEEARENLGWVRACRQWSPGNSLSMWAGAPPSQTGWPVPIWSGLSLDCRKRRQSCSAMVGWGSQTTAVVSQRHKVVASIIIGIGDEVSPLAHEWIEL